MSNIRKISFENKFCCSWRTCKPTIWGGEGGKKKKKKEDYCCNSFHYSGKLWWADPGWIPAVPEAFLSFPTSAGQVDLLHHRLQGNLCSAAQNTCSFSFFTDLGVCWAVSFMYSLLSLQLPVVQVGFFYPFLNNVISEALPPWQVGQWQVHPGVPWHWFHQTQQDSGSFPQKTPLEPSSFHNLSVQTQYTSLGTSKFIQEITVWVIR